MFTKTFKVPAGETLYVTVRVPDSATNGSDVPPPFADNEVGDRAIGSGSVVMFSELESLPGDAEEPFSPRTLNAKEVSAARLLKVWSFVTLVLPTAPLV